MVIPPTSTLAFVVVGNRTPSPDASILRHAHKTAAAEGINSGDAGCLKKENEVSAWSVPLMASVSILHSDDNNEAIHEQVEQSVRQKLHRVTQGYSTHIERKLKLLTMEIELSKKSEHALRYHLFAGTSNGNEKGRQLLSRRLEENRSILMECLETNSQVVQQLLLQRENAEETNVFTDVSVVQSQESAVAADNNNESDVLLSLGSGGVADGQTSSKETEGYDTAIQVISHAARDWTSGAQPCRDAIHGWMLQELKDWSMRTKNNCGATSSINVLVPGAGLGRLAYDISTCTELQMANDDSQMIEVQVEANDSSPIMAVASKSVLEWIATISQKQEAEEDAANDMNLQVSIHPFASDPKTNEVDSQKRLDSDRFPDNEALEAFHRSKLKAGGTLPKLSYNVGDFVATYSSASRKGRYGVIATAFFIDTATNIYEYVAIMKHLLRRSYDGSTSGVWINCGPVQWHPCALLRPTVDELRDILIEAGFELMKWELAPKAVAYKHPDEVDGGTPPRYTRSEAYRPLRFVATLKDDDGRSEDEASGEDLPLHLSIEYCEYVNKVAQGRG